MRRPSTLSNWPSANSSVLFRMWLLLLGAVLLPFIVAAQGQTNTEARSLAELQDAVAGRGRVILSFRVEGVVCAVNRERGLMTLQDDSGSALLELPAIEPSVIPGSCVRVEGKHCALTRSQSAIQLGTAPVVNNDGTHPALLKSGSVFLTLGWQPIRVEWFNGSEGLAFDLAYEGPGVARQPIPDEALWHKPVKPSATNAFEPGVDYAAYEGPGWFALPEFARLKPVATGVAANFDLTRRSRETGVALVFTGWLRVAEAGVYTFHLESDDGSRLWVGDPKAACALTVLPGTSTPVIESLEQVLVNPGARMWTEVEGLVTFAGPNDGGLELELASGEERIQVTVIGGTAPEPAGLLHRRIRATGICETSGEVHQGRTIRLTVPDAEQIKLSETSDAGTLDGAVLTAARQVQRLKPKEAEQHLPVKLKGVVTQASPRTLVLQDPTSGVFVHYSADDWTDQPRVGELWEIEGATDPGDFSPVIRATTGKFLGGGALPRPVRPTWDQLMNGSLDAQYVELQGVVTAVSDTGLTLLTPDGRIKVAVDELRWSYVDGRELFVTRHDSVALEQMRRTYLGSLVKIRGCLVAVWNEQTRQVKAGEIRMVAAVVAVEEPRLDNPFSLATRSTADLLRFDPRASALHRTKLAGQVIHVRPPEYFLLDGQTGLRVLAREPLALVVGDLVEAVGFPRLGGSAPVLLEADLRKTGAAALPPPVKVDGQSLLSREHDATLVQVEALLLSDSLQQDARVLELQAGQCHFIARLKPGPRTWKPLTPGSRLQLTGVQASVTEARGASDLAPFELLLNNHGAIIVLQQGPWWTVRHTITVVAVLVVGLCLALIWIKLLRRQVEERTAQLAQEIKERQRAEHHREMEQERTRVAHDLHDELGAGLTEMGILGSLVKNPGVPLEEKERYLDQLTESSRALVTGLDEIVWAINPQYDSVGSLATYYSFFAERFLNLAGIVCRLRVAESLPERPLDSKIRHSVFLAFKEALNNIVRHAGATEVELKIEAVQDQLTISIRDNGRGFAPTAAAPGSDGLAGMRERLQQLGGMCEIHSEPGQGTTVEFRLGLKGMSK